MKVIESKAKEYYELADRARRVLLEFFDSQDDFTSKDLGKARIAASALSTCTRFEQVRGAQDAMRLRIGIELSKDKEALADYIRVTMPQYSVAKTLPGKVAT